MSRLRKDGFFQAAGQGKTGAGGLRDALLLSRGVIPACRAGRYGPLESLPQIAQGREEQDQGQPPLDAARGHEALAARPQIAAHEPAQAQQQAQQGIGADPLLGLLLGLGGLMGSYLGARCQRFVPARRIKWGLALILLFTSLRYLWQGF